MPRAAGDKPDAAAGLYAPLPGVLVCCCGTAVAPERAGDWARGVLKAVQPQRMLLLGAMQVRSGLGWVWGAAGSSAGAMQHCLLGVFYPGCPQNATVGQLAGQSLNTAQ